MTWMRTGGTPRNLRNLHMVNNCTYLYIWIYYNTGGFKKTANQVVCLVWSAAGISGRRAFCEISSKSWGHSAAGVKMCPGMLKASEEQQMGYVWFLMVDMVGFTTSLSVFFFEGGTLLMAVAWSPIMLSETTSWVLGLRHTGNAQQPKKGHNL
jgi:hypothetical protein